MTKHDHAIWPRMLAHLRAAHPQICRHWFDDLHVRAVGAGVIEVVVHDDVQRRYLQRECIEHFNDAAREATGMLLAVRFCAADEPLRTQPAPGPRPTANGRHGAQPRLTDELAYIPDYTFDNFVVGRSNQLAHAAAVASANNPGDAYNPLFIHGASGLGKTHLLQAICRRVEEKNPDAVILYISCEGFITRFVEAVSLGNMADFRHQFRDVDLLVIDDIHFLARRDRTQDEFFHTFNALYQSKRQIVLSCDAPPEEIPDLEERLVSRFKWGLVANIQAPDHDTRVAIIKNKAAVRGVAVPDDAADFIARRAQPNIRVLEGDLNTVQASAIISNAPISLDIARQALGEPAGPSKPARITIESIVEGVTSYYEVTLTNLQSRKRTRSIAQPRQVAMYLARRHTRYSLEEIGGYFGGRDHTTVLHAVRTTEAHREHDRELDDAIRSLEKRLVPAGERRPGSDDAS